MLTLYYMENKVTGTRGPLILEGRLYASSPICGFFPTKKKLATSNGSQDLQELGC